MSPIALPSYDMYTHTWGGLSPGMKAWEWRPEIKERPLPR